jgi:cell pole-organizing protein PopZ
MEDILASIRRILNDETDPPPPEPAVPTATEPHVADVFELEHSMIVEDPAPELPAPDAFAPPIEEPAHRMAQAEDEPLLAPSAAAAATASMGALVRVLGQRQTPLYHGGPSLEDIVRDELRPLLKTWLDEHLAPLVERSVRAEIDRLTRGQS